ncbi:hypothetical protein L596_012437 [Steinernema carpocapsae]|uniref:Uncharacterized protein n=1 Tax=Steinernema carpocapsae TaxID=34508 RepID=A0A4U5NX26_STECR|nr:hypothetical protein L596_012437 [Steinernema carpocapsae]
MSLLQLELFWIPVAQFVFKWIGLTALRLRNQHQRKVSNLDRGDFEDDSCSKVATIRAPPQHRSEFVLPMCEFDTSQLARDRYDFENLDEYRMIPASMSQSSYAELGGNASRRASFGYAHGVEPQRIYQKQPARKLSTRVTAFEHGGGGVSSNEEATTSSSMDDPPQHPVRVKVRPTQPAVARSMSSLGPPISRTYLAASTPGLNTLADPITDGMSQTETSNSSICTPTGGHFAASFNGGMRNSPSFQQMKRQQMKLNLSTPNSPMQEQPQQQLPYASSRRSSTIVDFGQSESASEMNSMIHHNHSAAILTPNKIAVAPIQKPRRSERDDREYGIPHGHHHASKRSHNDKRVMPLRSPYQCTNSPSSSGSSARSPSVGARVGSPLSTPVPIDLPPGTCPSNAELAERVRFLEQCLSGVVVPEMSMNPSTTSLMFASGSSHNPGTPTSRIHRTAQLVVSTTPHINPYSSITHQQHIMARDVVEKDYTIEALKKQLDMLHKQMETRQIQYDEDVNSFKKESEDARSQLLTLKSKIGDLENESKVYQEKSTRLDQARQVAMVESQEKMTTQEKELSTLRQELAKKEQLTGEYEQMKKERDWLDKQNASLSQQLDESDNLKKRNETLLQRLNEKDAQMKELEDTIIALEMKANMSLSAHGRGLLYDDEDDDISIDHLLPSGSETPISSSTFDLRVTRSASTHQIGSDSSSNRIISQQMSSMFMALLRKSNECKTLARCLSDTASSALDGKEPNFNKLLGCYSDVSESDSEPMMKGSVSNSMTTAVAERYLRKNNEDLARVEQLLDELRSKFVAYYQQRSENKQCQIQ